MKYQILSSKEFEYGNILPDSLCGMAAAGELLVCAGQSEEGILDCVAAFSMQPFHRDEAMLQYIYVPQEKRRRGYAHGLLKDCKEKMKQMGIRAITVREYSEDTGIQRFLRYEGFIPMSFCGRMYEYPLFVFTENALLKRIPEERLKSVTEEEEDGDIRVKHFRNQSAKEGFYMGDDGSDRSFHFFYREGQQFTACLLGERYAVKRLFVARSHKLSICTEPAAWAYLFVACVKKAQQQMPADSVVLLQSFSKGEQEFLEKISNHSGKVLRIREWACRV